MTKQIATLGILVEKYESIPEVNALLHHFSNCIISRMGMPYEKRNIRLIHVVMDTEFGDIEKLTEQLNAINGIIAQAMFF
ncbi:MAG: CopG family transcriptional regulator [Alphaproteobacteria bacterium]|nr:CopG family transcriptional regulator [Alphaproteobacteria bacterium]